MSASPLDGDPRAYRIADIDGLPVECGVGDDGTIWLIVHGTVCRLEAVLAMKLGGRLNGCGQRAVGARQRARAAGQ